MTRTAVLLLVLVSRYRTARNPSSNVVEINPRWNLFTPGVIQIVSDICKFPSIMTSLASTLYQIRSILTATYSMKTHQTILNAL
jgi:hypothetical protein